MQSRGGAGKKIRHGLLEQSSIYWTVARFIGVDAGNWREMRDIGDAEKWTSPRKVGHVAAGK